uniref:Uncharacterized protein n=1 Tax=Amphimedon queenslandica TaxID=400682 RepID=A0A1X7UCX6_AMPQE
ANMQLYISRYYKIISKLKMSSISIFIRKV